MIKIINFTIKIILSILVILMWYVNIIIVLIMWDGKFMVVDKLVHLIWEKPESKEVE
jgi:hypothetical protein